MANTILSDIVEPRVFLEYTLQLATQKSRAFQSKLVSTTSLTIPDKGRQLDMPFWNEIDDAEDILQDTVALVPDKLTTGQELAIIHARGRSWSINDLAEMVSGTVDPLASMGVFLADYWARKYNQIAFSTLKGSVVNQTIADLVNDISAASGVASNITAEAAYDTLQKKGDTAGELTMVVMHSAVRTYLSKLDLIDFLPDSTGMPVQSYLGMTVVVDDTNVDASGVYFTFFASEGAISYDSGTKPELFVEFDRDINAGDDEMASRQRFIMHPKGFQYSATVPAGQLGVANTALATGTNWTRVREVKNCKVVALKHKINQVA